MLTNAPLECTTVTTMLPVEISMDHMSASARQASLEMELKAVVKVKLSKSFSLSSFFHLSVCEQIIQAAL